MPLLYSASFVGSFASAFRLCYSLYVDRLVAFDLRSRSIAHNASACTRVEFLWSGILHSFIPFACDFTTDVFIGIHIAPPRAFLIVSEMQHDGCDAYARGYSTLNVFLTLSGLNFFNLRKKHVFFSSNSDDIIKS